MMLPFKKWINQLKPKNKISNSEQSTCDYFQTATSWADDMTVELIDSRQRYRLGFYGMLLCTALLAITIVVLDSTQTFHFVVLEHWPDGSVTEHTQLNNKRLFQTSLIKSELVKYVVNRESYHPSTYEQQYHSIIRLSNAKVAKEYQFSQSRQNKTAPIKVLGNHGTRRVTIQPPIVFYDRKTRAHDNQHKNIAVVNFSVVERNHISGKITTTPLAATIQWTHLGAPTNPKAALENWDGFTVTHYVLEPRNVTLEPKEKTA